MGCLLNVCLFFITSLIAVLPSRILLSCLLLSYINITLLMRWPFRWQDEPVARILELCILHIAMAEMQSKGTPHKVAINEVIVFSACPANYIVWGVQTLIICALLLIVVQAVDLAKRFCDGGAPRVINGCLRTYVKDHTNNDTSQPAESKPWSVRKYVLQRQLKSILVWRKKKANDITEHGENLLCLSNLLQFF